MTEHLLNNRPSANVTFNVVEDVSEVKNTFYFSSKALMFKNGPIQPSFSLFSSFQYIWL